MTPIFSDVTKLVTSRIRQMRISTYKFVWMEFKCECHFTDPQNMKTGSKH